MAILFVGYSDVSGVARRAIMKVLLFANTDWYLYNFRLPLAKEIRNRGHEVVFLSPPGEFGKKLQAAGFRWITINMNRRSLNIFSEFSVLGRLMVIVRLECPDIIHLFTIKCVIYGSLIARYLHIPARINAVAGMGYIYSNTGLKARLLRPLVSRLMKFALGGDGARLILQNNQDLETFVNLGLIKRSNIKLIRGSGVDTTRFTPPDVRLDGTTRVLLATRLLWDKGVKEFVEAAYLLKKKKLNIEFLIAGTPDEGNPDAVPLSQIEEWRESGLVKILGHVDNMADLLKKVDICVLPTSYGEGVPRILIEAAATGLPIVATDTAGCREIVEHEKTGLLVTEKDSAALALSIQRLHENKNLQLNLGKNGRKRAVLEFDEALVIENTLNVYKDVLSRFS